MINEHRILDLALAIKEVAEQSGIESEKTAKNFLGDVLAAVTVYFNAITGEDFNGLRMTHLLNGIAVTKMLQQQYEKLSDTDEQENESETCEVAEEPQIKVGDLVKINWSQLLANGGAELVINVCNDIKCAGMGCDYEFRVKETHWKGEPDNPIEIDAPIDCLLKVEEVVVVARLAC